MVTFQHIKQDLPASIVVFFVAIPLCLGISLASGAPLFAGIISGIVGGILVGFLSDSTLGVSGPAAGLVVITLSGMQTLQGWENFLTAVCLSGIIQVIMGYARLGFIAYYFPNSVIKGMLSGIGIIIILKQLPHLVGYDQDYFGDIDFYLHDNNTFQFIQTAFESINPGVLLISLLSLGILMVWDTPFLQRNKITNYIQSPLLVVVIGILYSYLCQQHLLPFTLNKDQLVYIPEFDSIKSVMMHLTHPSFSILTHSSVYTVAFTLAIVGSIETLLCVDATDKLDPHKRITPANRELKAQGLGNLISGFLGGLPITQVIVRSSTNISFGAKTKLSTILHGVFLLLSVLLIPELLNLIPLASLACILMFVGYKLANPDIFKTMYRYGQIQFVPFLVTVVVMQFSDLLKGVLSGLIVSIFYILKKHYLNDYQLSQFKKGKSQIYDIQLAEDVSFLNKGALLEMFRNIPNGAVVNIDFRQNKNIDQDVQDVIEEFKISSLDKDITLNLIGKP